MARRVEDQVVVVTGASSGVGRAIARAFGGRGAKVGLIARNGEALENAAHEMVSGGGEGLPLPLDVSDAEAVQRAADEVVARWGRIDTWINDAMVSVFSPVSQMTADEFRRVTEVTYLGTVHGTVAALEHMRERDEGTIIQIGSALAYRSIPLQSAYCAAKAAIRGFTDSLRSEAPPRGQPGPPVDAPAPSGQHPAVRRRPLTLAAPPPARAAHLPAGDRRACGASRRRAPGARDVARDERVEGDPRTEVHPRPPRPLPRPARLRLAADLGAGRARPSGQPGHSAAR
ncbi:MAG: SDR family oxidoreductase [Myxococcales bacterium]